MYSRNSFGSFYPVDSSVHRLNPVVKLFNLGPLFMITPIFLRIVSYYRRCMQPNYGNMRHKINSNYFMYLM